MHKTSVIKFHGSQLVRISTLIKHTFREPEITVQSYPDSVRKNLKMLSHFEIWSNITTMYAIYYYFITRQNYKYVIPTSY